MEPDMPPCSSSSVQWFVFARSFLILYLLTPKRAAIFTRGRPPVSGQHQPGSPGVYSGHVVPLLEPRGLPWLRPCPSPSRDLQPPIVREDALYFEWRSSGKCCPLYDSKGIKYDHEKYVREMRHKTAERLDKLYKRNPQLTGAGR